MMSTRAAMVPSFWLLHTSNVLGCMSRYPTRYRHVLLEIVVHLQPRGRRRQLVVYLL